MIYSVIYLSKCQVAERALYFWNSEHLCVNVLSQSRANVFLPYVFGPLSDNARGHWNLTVEGLAQSVLKMYMEMDQTLYDRCARYVCTHVCVYVCTDLHVYVLLYLRFYKTVPFFYVLQLFRKYLSDIVFNIKISLLFWLWLIQYLYLKFTELISVLLFIFHSELQIYIITFYIFIFYFLFFVFYFLFFIFCFFIFNFFEERILILHGLGMRKGKQQQINGQRSLQQLP